MGNRLIYIPEVHLGPSYDNLLSLAHILETVKGDATFNEDGSVVIKAIGGDLTGKRYKKRLFMIEGRMVQKPNLMARLSGQEKATLAHGRLNHPSAERTRKFIENGEIPGVTMTNMH